MIDPETIVKEAETIAVVGLSDDPEKPSREVGIYLKEHKATASSR